MVEQAQTESLTREAAEFAVDLKYEDLPEDARHIGRRCVLAITRV